VRRSIDGRKKVLPSQLVSIKFDPGKVFFYVKEKSNNRRLHMLLNDTVKKEAKTILQLLTKPVEIIVFTQEVECDFCKDTRELAKEVASLSDKIRVAVYDFLKDKAKVAQYAIDKIPALVVKGDKDRGIRFYGLPAGYEFTSLLEALKLVSHGTTHLSSTATKFLDSLQKDIHLQVFVTPTCPYCPSAVILAHELAYYSDKVRADMVEISEFPHLAQKYMVMGVPRTVINESVFQEGAASEAMLLEKLKNVK
jgi:glutaredoxin-like protein